MDRSVGDGQRARLWRDPASGACPSPAFRATGVFVTTAELMAPGRQPVAGRLLIDDGGPQQEDIEKYREADVLDDYGFRSGSGASRTGWARRTPGW